MQKITPFLLLNHDLQEVIDFYTSAFDNAKSGKVSKTPNGEVFTATFEIDGSEFILLKGGPDAALTPAISFSINCKTEEEVDKLWSQLSNGGKELMALDKYDFSEKYGWCNDKYGVSWQISLVPEYKQKIIPSFLFVQNNNGKAEEAMNLYTSLFKNSNVNFIQKYPEGSGNDGAILYGNFTLEGQEFVAMDSNLNHQFNFTMATSLYVNCKNQAEVDYFWEGLLKNGGKESMCGWIEDKYGVYWQIIPEQLPKLMNDSDTEKASKVMDAMMTMQKIDIAEIEKAYNS